MMNMNTRRTVHLLCVLGSSCVSLQVSGNYETCMGTSVATVTLFITNIIMTLHHQNIVFMSQKLKSQTLTLSVALSLNFNFHYKDKIN